MDMKAFIYSLLLIGWVVGIGACEQQSVKLPERSGVGQGGECGPSYPKGEGDAQAVYGFSKGDTWPCFVWESVRIGELGTDANTYLSMSELYVQYTQRKKAETAKALAQKYGISNPRSILIAISAMDCSACQDLIPAISAHHDDFSSAGTIMIGVAFTSFEEATVTLSLKEADEVLMSLGKKEWREEWHRTNDEEALLYDHVPSFPEIIVVRLEDMKIVDKGTLYDHKDLTPLLDIVKNIEKQ